MSKTSIEVATDLLVEAIAAESVADIQENLDGMLGRAEHYAAVAFQSRSDMTSEEIEHAKQLLDTAQSILKFKGASNERITKFLLSLADEDDL